MRKQYVIGNWKMHGSKTFVTELLSNIKDFVQKNQSNVNIIVCPPYVFLDQTQIMLKKSQLQWGGQNMAAEQEGPYTGEISTLMLYEFGCRYVLLGHSERRQLYGETNAQIAKKFNLAIKSGLTPILCVGETLAERQANQTHAILQTQLEKIVDYGSDVLKRAIIAYEPVWAIGTGLSAQPEQAQEVHQFLREYIKFLGSDLAQELPILYGGSVKVSNAEALFQMPDIDGGLIGGASLDAVEFLHIYRILVSIADRKV
ncbi:triose-phosphate isomerase [Rickettsiella endosymbiont of Litargus connexus]|jgi:triosephosphate isomerase (TIM)|uniref:triose-phosphate isomerase n=1 Tax=Rickettsiella endosymbiont of Litargus connexus TaxID=3066237 RepID=UPI0027EF11AF|nr:triose-phosphate isomerase [Gammaproteobacteria bacterium]MCH9755291.1 triose-phosphate isomerase [Gammaproteobacteria bacterium]MDD4892890.1 triose-phosphate isomerase [Candidatus Rickettsiella isopodorum]MDD5162073.1 triose-phosphate isomerase [Candidatus Rickettsiella isopodorum]MDQ5899666.1 Triosephosphate isomerase [Pseudomonadota bacterium]